MNELSTLAVDVPNETKELAVLPQAPRNGIDGAQVPESRR